MIVFFWLLVLGIGKFGHWFLGHLCWLLVNGLLGLAHWG